MGGQESKQHKQDVSFNRLPSLVKQWDKQQQDNISKFQENLIKRSAALSKQSMAAYNKDGNNDSDNLMIQSAPSIEIKFNMESSKVLNNYLNTANEEEVEEQKQRLLPDKQLTKSVSDNFSINEEKNGNPQQSRIAYETHQDPEALNSLSNYKPPQNKGGVGTEEEFQMSEREEIERERAQLKKYIMSSIIEEEQISFDENHKNNYKLIYKSNVLNVSAVLPDQENYQRTVSFHEEMHGRGAEFKKDQKTLMQKMKQLSTTQRLFGRNDRPKPVNNDGNKKNARLSVKEQQQVQVDNDRIYQERKKELQQKAQERKQKLDKDNFLKINRDQTINSVCEIIFKHIQAAQAYIEDPTQAAMLFHEQNFKGQEWLVQTTSGYSSTMPLFLYVLEDVPYEEKPCNDGDLILFMRKIFDKMQLATECIIVTLIYLEKVMINGGIEMRYCNWKPLLFTAILLASKFWEDINFWNVDYVDALRIYNLKSINRMESEFVSLCEYNLFVSADLYTQYYMAVRDHSKPSQTESIKPQQNIKITQLEKTNIVSVKQAQNTDINRTTSFVNQTSVQLPIFYINNSGDLADNSKHETSTVGPQYPSLKMNVSYYQKEASDIMEESIEEKKRTSVRDSKIKKRLNAAALKDTIDQKDEENMFKIQIEEEQMVDVNPIKSNN